MILKHMKWLLILFLFHFANVISALPLSNPIAASLFTCHTMESCNCDPNYLSWLDDWKVELGFIRYSVNSQKLCIDTRQSQVTKSFDSISIDNYLASLSFNYLNIFEVFFHPGATSLIENVPATAIGLNPDTASSIVTNTCFGWGIGGRITLLEWHNWGIGAEAEYFQSRLSINKFGNVYPSNSKFIYRATQAGIGIAYRTTLFACSSIELIPYFGGRATMVQINTGNPQWTIPTQDPIVATIRKQQQNRVWGTSVGCTILANKCCQLNFEWEFLNETANSIHFSFAF